MIKKGTPEYAERNKAYSREYRKRNPNADKERYKRESFKILVRSYTRYHFKKYYQCKDCSSKKGLDFHHIIYTMPVEQDHFVTLCKPCHKARHKDMKND